MNESGEIIGLIDQPPSELDREVFKEKIPPAETEHELLHHVLSLTKPLRNHNFPIGTRAWVVGAGGGNLELEVYYTNLSGSNRHRVTISTKEYLGNFQDHGLNYKSPAPEIGHL